MIGAGAVGGLIAGSLSEKFRDRVFVIEKDPLSREAIKTEGINYEIRRNGSYEPFHSFPRIQEETPKLAPDDLIIVALKQYSFQEIMPLLEQAPCKIVLAQNGYNPLYKRIEKKSIHAVIEFAASYVKAGHSMQTTRGKITLGVSNGLDRQAKELSEELSTERLVFDSTDDFAGLFWSKLIYNSAMNAVTALIGENYHTVFANPEARELAAKVYIESFEIARRYSKSIPASMGFSPDRTAQFLRMPLLKNGLYFVSRKFKDVASSMLQDIRRGRQTEIDYINGYLSRKAEEKRINARLNKQLVEIIHEIERGNLVPSLKNLKLLSYSERHK